MSRRRTARVREQHRHLERTEGVAQVVAEHVQVDSRGPCPGKCNRLHRARKAQRDEVRAAAYLAAVADVDPLGVPAGFLEEVEAQADAVADEAVNVPDPRRGRPVWCPRCASDIKLAVESVPNLIAWTVEIGAPMEPTRPLRTEWGGRHGSDGLPVSAPVQVLDVRPAPDPGLVTEVLGCGHRYTRPMGPAHPDQTRVCLTCIAAGTSPEPGRLAPLSKAARGASGKGKPKVSPAGSPAWLEVEAALEWVCSRAEQLRYLMRQSAVEYPWRDGSVPFRLRAARDAVDHLASWMDTVLASELSERFGFEAMAVTSRLLQVSGRDELVHRLDAECPICQRRALVRHDGADRVLCRSCQNTWDEKHYQHLVRVQAFELEHPELREQSEPEEES